MRTVTGRIILPANCPAGTAGLVLIEVRDVSMADAPSTVVAEQRLSNVPLAPHGQIGFSLQFPEVAPNRTLSLRVHVNLDGSGQLKPGDLLTTASHPVPEAGGPVVVNVSVV